MLVGRAHEGHVAVTRRAIDGHAGIHQFLAGRINIVDLEGEMAEVTRFAVILGIPIKREFDLRRGPALFLAVVNEADIVSAGDEDKGVAVLLVHPAPRLLKPELVAIKIQRRIEIADTQHGVQVTHGENLAFMNSSWIWWDFQGIALDSIM